MKRWFMLVLTLLLVSLCACALAQEAEEITSCAKFKVSYDEGNLSTLTDGKYKPYWTCSLHGWCRITLPEDKPCYGIYICWADHIVPWKIEVPDGADGWKTLYTSEDFDAFYNQYIPLPGLTVFRLTSCTDGKHMMCVSEIRLLGQGDLPDWVQTWHKMDGKADLMLLVAHPDDEELWFGGLLPYYGGELHKKVIVVYMANTHSRRKSELLDGLWLCGIRDYPEIGVFDDEYLGSSKEMYELWGEKRVLRRVVTMLRTYQPDVVVTHDIHGEYGHGAHKLCANAMTRCLAMAADASCEFAQELAPWQAKKLYIHLYGKNKITMDWSRPLAAFGGKTGLEVAAEAYKKHISQQSTSYQVAQPGSRYDSTQFGLYYTAVGEDVERNDFFEHLETFLVAEDK